METYPKLNIHDDKKKLLWQKKCARKPIIMNKPKQIHDDQKKE